MTAALASNVVPLAHPDRFDEFWAACPKKVDKPLCRAKWNAITSERGLKTRTLDRDSGMFVEVHLKATADELIKAMWEYKRSQIVPTTINDRTPLLIDGGKFTMQPATWLNRGRWEK